MKTHLVIGLGEVGTAIKTILEQTKDNVQAVGRGSNLAGLFDVVHICIPVTPRFKNIVRDYVKKYLVDKGLLIIHSSTPIGTCKSLGAVHHPIRGTHPNLIRGIIDSVNYFGGERANEAAILFQDLVQECRVILNSKDTEAAKLLDTTQYGLMIMIEKEIYKFCSKNHLNHYIVYEQFNETYNQMYAESKPRVVRPFLKHMNGPIGGHCVIGNAKLLKGFDLAKLLLNKNKTY